MKKIIFISFFSFLLIYCFLISIGCSAPIVKIPKSLPPIVKEYKHVMVYKSTSDKNTKVYLNKGDFYSTFVDPYHKRAFLRARIGKKVFSISDRFQANSTESGYLYLGSYTYDAGVDIIVWEREDYDQIVQFLEKMKERDPDNEEINDAIITANGLKTIQLASEKTTKEIEETKKIIQELEEEPKKEKEQTIKTVPKEKPALEAKPLTVEAGKQDRVAQLEAKLEELMETLAQLKEMKKEFVEEKKKTSLLTKQLEEKKKEEKDLLVKLKHGSKTAPVIVIASPKDESKVEINIIQLSGVAEDEKGLARLEIFINNKPIEKKQYDRGISVTGERNPKRLDFKKRIPLEKGVNRIKIRVVDADGLSSEKVVTVYHVEKRRNIWAVVIGINKYPNIRQLKYAVNDAKIFHDYLVLYNHIPAENVTLLIDQEATLTKLRSTLGTHLKSKAGKDDMVIIFFAGHGATEKDVMSPDGDGLEKYLMPYDVDPKDLYASALPMREISHIFNRIQSERLVFIADSCYSGASGGRTIGVSGVRANISEAFLDRITIGKGRVIMTASGANEVSAENDELQHGVFTYFLVEGLRGKADADKDGLISVDEVYRYVSEQVPQATGQEQHPVKKGTVEGRLILSVLH